MKWLTKMTLMVVLGLSLPAFAGDIPAKLYRNPNCGCCDEYAKYLKAHGYEVELISTYDISAIKTRYQVPKRLEGCHTAVIAGYVFEGLIPVQSIDRVLKERPKIQGLSLPGIPTGAPGMPGNKKGPLEVYYLKDSVKPQVYETY